jgi:hypothetical protein
MSVVTDVFILVGDVRIPGEYLSAEEQAPRVAEAIVDYQIADSGYERWEMPVISLMRDDWADLQCGKVAGSAAIWFGYNYADIDGLVGHLRHRGFKHLTIWSHHENEKDMPPKVVSI